MRSFIRSHLSYANVMATVAVFLALGGISWAAATLPRNSVGSSQLKQNAVTSAKVKNGTLRSVDFAKGQLPTGAQGPAGATGPQGPAGSAGATGPKGVVGAVTVQFTQASSALTAGAEAAVNAFCPDGQKALGGGARGDATDSEDTTVGSSRPAISPSNTEPPIDGQTFSGWRASVRHNPGSSATDVRPEVWVVCAAE